MSRIGKFVWWENYTTDVAASVAFYTGLFGWTVNEMEMGDMTYRMIMNGESMLGGILPSDAANGAPSHWLSYLNVEDVDASTAKAKELGATVLMEPADIPAGRFSVVADPQGAVFAPWKTANPPENPDDSVKLNEFSWVELHAANVDEALPFYQELVGWVDKAVDMGNGTYHLEHRPGFDGPDDRAEAGAMNRMSEEVPPNWLPYVAVEDVDATAVKVGDLGGNVVVPATDIPDVGRFIIFIDPTGGMLAAITFAES